MTHPKSSLLIVLMYFSSLMISFSCILPEDPDSPSNTRVGIIIKNSTGDWETVLAENSLGNTVIFGITAFLPENIESAVFKIVDSDQEILLDTTIVFESSFRFDTVWISEKFWKLGVKDISVTPHSRYTVKVVSGKLLIHDVSQSETGSTPSWRVTSFPIELNDAFPYSLDLQSLFEDPDGDEPEFTLLNGEPSGDTVADGTYRFTPTPGSAGSHKVKIVAADSDGAGDTLTIKLTITDSQVDTTAPSITILTPAENATVPTKSLEIDLICTDAGGIASVIASTGTAPLELLIQEGHYRGAITGLLPGNNTITFTAIDASPAANTSTKMVIINYELQKTFTVKYDGNNNVSGKVPIDTNRYRTGEPATVLNNTGNLVKTWSTFSGWNSAADGNGDTYMPGSSLTIGESDAVLFALWSRVDSFSLTISGTNGSVKKVPDSPVYVIGTIVELVPQPAEGYHFAGWSGDLSGNDNPASITIDSDKALVAAFAANKPDSYTLTVLGTNGTIIKTPDLDQYVSGTAVGLKAIPDSGFSFISWSGDASGTADSTTVLLDVSKKINAHFTLKKYHLEVNAEAGGSITLPAISAVEVDHGMPTDIIATPETGYEFINWKVTGTAIVAAAESESTTVKLTGDAKVTANFTKKRYQLSVTSEEGGNIDEPSSSPIMVEHGVPYTISATAKTNYTFNGWLVVSGTANIANPSSISTTVTLTIGPFALKAQWVETTYSVTYNANGGTGTVPVDNTKYYNGSTATVRSNSGSLVNGASSFAGWSTVNGTTYPCGDSIIITGRTELYAKYSESEVMDNDGNTYTSVPLAGTKWLVQNLKTTKYRDGSSIIQVTNESSWGGQTQGAYCWPGYSIVYKECGALYNGAALQARQLTPAGWRLPSDAEWTALFDYWEACELRSIDTTFWNYNDCKYAVNINLSGFTAFANGVILGGTDNAGVHSSFGSHAFWWVSDGGYAEMTHGMVWTLQVGDTDIGNRGYGIRCVKE